MEKDIESLPIEYQAKLLGNFAKDELHNGFKAKLETALAGCGKDMDEGELKEIRDCHTTLLNCGDNSAENDKETGEALIRWKELMPDTINFLKLVRETTVFNQSQARHLMKFVELGANEEAHAMLSIFVFFFKKFQSILSA